MSEIFVRQADMHIPCVPGSAAAEIAALHRGGHRARLELSPLEAFILIDQLQVALRQPGNTGVSADCARAWIRSLASFLPQSEAVAELIRLGWEQQT